MTRFKVVRLVAGRELHERIRSKAFWISFGVSLTFVLAVAILPGVLRSDGPTIYDVGVFGPGADQLAARLPVVAPAIGNVAVKVRNLADASEGERLVTTGKLDAAMGEGRVVVDKELGDRLGFLVQEANRQVVVEAALAGARVPPDVAGRVLRPQPLEVRAIDPKSDAETEKQGMVVFGTVLLFGQLMGYGYWVASGVVEEKVSRIVEILLVKARPAQLLAGKVIGIGLVGLVQLVAFVVIGLVTAGVSGSVDLPREIVAIAAQIIGWFVLGFALYSCLFAVGGAMASRVEELQSTTTPLTFIAVGSFFAAMTAGGDPGGPVAKIATFIPFSAPMVLPIRVAAGEVSVGVVILSVAIVLASIVAVMALAARVYAGGVLHLRGQLKLRAAITSEAAA